MEMCHKEIRMRGKLARTAYRDAEGYQFLEGRDEALESPSSARGGSDIGTFGEGAAARELVTPQSDCLGSRAFSSLHRIQFTVAWTCVGGAGRVPVTVPVTRGWG
jgi:hypothetical protein